MNFFPPVFARSGATKQSSWIATSAPASAATVGCASLAMTNREVHQPRSEESNRINASGKRGANPSGFFAALRMTGRGAAAASLALAVSAFAATPGDTEWSEYLGGPERNHFSTLTQITPANVAQLRVAWEYHTGDFGEVQCNPLVVAGVLYGVSAAGDVFALEAATGRELWRFSDRMETPAGRAGQPTFRILRGLTYWADGADQRILFTSGPWLCALDATTGRRVTAFGDGGKTSLKQSLGESAAEKYVISTTPGALWGDLLIMPLRVSEVADAAPGYVQAFNVRTGALAWTFRTIPQPGEFGYETWPKEAWRNVDVGGANSWPGMAVDRVRGIVFVPTGSASPDFWGGSRVGANLFANCLLALDAKTGKRLWHFQFVHHDLWDRDLPSPPNLVTIMRDGRKVDAVAQVTKSGYVFVFDRMTGTPLFPVEEIAVPKSGLPGEVSSPTQPLPAKPAPFSRQTLTEGDISRFAENREALLAKFRAARMGTFEPFGLQDTVFLPGFDGGAEWGGAAVDPAGVLYVNANEMAWIARLRETPTTDALAALSGGQRAYATYCVACHGVDRRGNPAGNVPPMVDVATRRTRLEVAQSITSGKGMMPGFPALPAAEKEALVDFLFGTEKSEGGAAPTVASAAPAGSPLAPAPVAGRAPYRLDGYVRFVDSKGYPAINPPWGTLTAIDLNTGEHRWQIPLGEFKELMARDITQTGAENYGGPVVTAGGVLFIAATKDGMFRAFDPKNGKALWETELPAPGFATPSTYAVGGKQFVVVAAGGTKLGTKKGDSYIAYALPDGAH
jgi:quinoprotein glucose dehydrogenase